jgi:dTDP-4-dehydrorhamnose 3,5-epimerase
MKVTPTSLEGVLLLSAQVFGDSRGCFYEMYHAERYRKAGLPRPFVQDNVSVSSRGVVRGLHFQNPQAQAKLVTVLTGEIFDVAVDIRRGSSNFGKWVGVILSDENRDQLFVPEGFAHGFCVLSDRATVLYKCTELYFPEAEQSIFWNDPALKIDWPIQQCSLSEKDARAPLLGEIPPHRLPSW